MFAAYSPRAASAYQRINVETSMHTMDQHQLVSLLYQGVLTSIAAARGAIARGDVLTKCNSIAKAIRIIEEGLLTALDRQAGGELASNLEALYDYSLRRLILAVCEQNGGLFGRRVDRIDIGIDLDLIDPFHFVLNGVFKRHDIDRVTANFL